MATINPQTLVDVTQTGNGRCCDNAVTLQLARKYVASEIESIAVLACKLLPLGGLMMIRAALPPIKEANLEPLASGNLARAAAQCLVMENAAYRVIGLEPAE